MNRLSRRSFARLAVRLAALWTTGAAAQSVDDRGLGGTGAVPTDPEETLGQDRGIGGTGVVGTIRRFGSIVVNDLRVSYPGNVRVTIDGLHATAADLRIGQVVRVLARTHASGLATRSISVTSEVVGPIDAVDDTGMTVLGQRILAERRLRAALRPGRIVAVSGLRRPDGAIVASLVVPRPAGTPARLAGPVTAAPDGRMRIGATVIVGLKESLAGRRVVLAGRRIGGAFHASAVTIEPAVPFADADRLSIEGYVARYGDVLRFGSGVTLAAGRVGAELDDDEVVRAVVTASAGERGLFSATGIRLEGNPRQSERSRGDVGRPGEPGRPRGVGPSTGGPVGPARGGSAGGGAPGGHGSGGDGGGNAQGGPSR